MTIELNNEENLSVKRKFIITTYSGYYQFIKIPKFVKNNV